MAMQYTYRELMPFFETQLAKLTPEARHAVWQGMKKPRTGWGSTPEWINGAHALAKQLGISPEGAERMLSMLTQGHRNPDEKYLDTENPEAFGTGQQLKARSAYRTDDELYQDFLKANGWDKLTTIEQDAEVAAEEEKVVEDQQSVRDRILAFGKEMMGDVGTNDPVYAQLVQSGTDAAQASAGAAGLSGRSGLAGTQAASVAQQNVAPYLAQRKSMGLGALATAGNLDLNYAQLAQADAQFAQNRADLMAGESWKAGQAQTSGMLGTIGAVGGGILGAYFGGPQGAAMGAQAGSGVMTSLGSMAGPQAPTYSTYKPKTYGSSNSSNKGGGAGF